MIIEPALINRNRDEISIDNDNVVINNLRVFLHYRRNDNGNFNIIYSKYNIGTKSCCNNKIWVLLNPDKDTIYNVSNEKKLELDSVIDIYEVKNNQKRDSYICVVSEVICENNIIDILGIVINPNTLNPLFIYSVNNNITVPIITPSEAKKIFGCPVSTNFRIKYTIEKITEKELDSSKSFNERYKILEKVIKKQSDRV